MGIVKNLLAYRNRMYEDKDIDWNYVVSCIDELTNFIGEKIKRVEDELLNRGIDAKGLGQIMVIVEKEFSEYVATLMDLSKKMKNQKGNLYKNELDAIKERLEECYGDSITFVKNKDYAAAYLSGNNTWRKILSNIFGYKKFVSKKLPLFRVSEDDAYLQAIEKGQSTTILHEKIHRQVEYLPSYIGEIHATYQMVKFWDENRFKELSTVELLRLYSSLTRGERECKLFKSILVEFLETKDSSVFGKKIDEAVDCISKYCIGAALLHDLVSRGMNYREALLQASKMGKLIKKKLLKETGYHHINVEKILTTLGIILDFYLYTLWKEAHHLRITYDGPSFEEWLSLLNKEYTYLLLMTVLTEAIFLFSFGNILLDKWSLYKNLKRAKEYKGIRVTELLAD